VVTISGATEKKFADAIEQTEHGNYLALDPESTQKFFDSAAKELEQLKMTEQSPVILCSPAIRMYVRQLLERFLPDVSVLSYNELEPTIEVQSLGVVNIT
jgi:flagellar biosynthesis protein FlhA